MSRTAAGGSASAPSLAAPVTTMAVSLTAIALGCAYVVWRWITPSTCGWVVPRATHFRSGALLVAGEPDCPLLGRPLTAATVDGPTAVFTTPVGPVSAALSDSMPLIGRLAGQNFSTLLYVVSLATLGLVYFLRRPADSAAQAAALSGSTVAGAGLAWVLGLPPEHAFTGGGRWLFLACVDGCFLLTWGATLAWTVIMHERQLRRPAPRRWWWLVPAPVVLWSLVALPAAVVSRTFSDWMAVASITEAAIALLFLVGCLVILVLQLLKLRQGDPVVVQQVKWAGGGATAGLLLMLAFWFVPLAVTGTTWLPHELIGLPGLLLVGGVAVSVFKHRAVEVDAVVVRTLVGSGLMLASVVLYLVITGVVAAVFTSVAPAGLTAAGVILLAVALNPIRIGLQRLVNRLFYGERDNPYITLARVAREVRSQQLPAVLHNMARGLRSPYAAVESDGTVVAAWGTAPAAPDDVVRVPLDHGGVVLGDLVIARRTAGEVYSKAESLLLADLAGPLASTLHEQQLSAQLRESRERIVMAREEERRQLRRTLHDDVAPTVAGIALKGETVRAMLDRPRPDLDGAGTVLSTLVSDAAAAATSLRTLSYDLRPPALDDRGLLEALRDRAADLQGVTAKFRTLGDWSQPLPAATEVAVYRIVSSALANVAQHARATTVDIELRRDAAAVHLRVKDDGRGLGPQPRPGVGLTAMRERAAELGGTFAASTLTSGGTVVEATIPLAGTP